MQVLGGGFQVAVPEQNLDGAQVGTRFQQVSRPTVAQRVRGDTFGDAGALRGIATGNPDSFVRNGLIESVLTGARRDERVRSVACQKVQHHQTLKFAIVLRPARRRRHRGHHYQTLPPGKSQRSASLTSLRVGVCWTRGRGGHCLPHCWHRFC
jgi:hypothetical protein